MLRRLARKILDRVRERPPAAAAPAPAAAAPASVPAPRPVVPPPAESLARIEAGAQEVKERIDAGEDVIIVDVRTAAERAAEHIPGSRFIPLHELDARWEELKDANEVVCQCAAGGRSLQAARLLREKGLFNATSMEGGIGAWKAAGGATVGA
jgi:rhodanese-related sulfurtransferase